MPHPPRAVAGEVARDLAAAHREADDGGVGEVELGHYVSQVVREPVVVVALPRLVGAAEAPAVISDGAVAVLGERQRQLVPGVRRKRPAVDQHHRGAAAPILDEQFNAVGRGHIRHFGAPPSAGCGRRPMPSPTAADHPG
jgi:hypothetical protein